MELVSIVVPVYKVEAYLDQCVQSIRNQTWKELEIILVDDGSPDRCGKMCEEYKELDQRIKVIHKSKVSTCCLWTVTIISPGIWLKKW